MKVTEEFVKEHAPVYYDYDKKLMAEGRRSTVKALINYMEFTDEEEAIDHLKKEEEDCIRFIKRQEEWEARVHKDAVKDFNKKFPKIEEAVNALNETGDINNPKISKRILTSIFDVFLLAFRIAEYKAGNKIDNDKFKQLIGGYDNNDAILDIDIDNDLIPYMNDKSYAEKLHYLQDAYALFRNEKRQAKVNKSIKEEIIPNEEAINKIIEEAKPFVKGMIENTKEWYLSIKEKYDRMRLESPQEYEGLTEQKKNKWGDLTDKYVNPEIQAYKDVENKTSKQIDSMFDIWYQDELINLQNKLYKIIDFPVTSVEVGNYSNNYKTFKLNNDKVLKIERITAGGPIQRMHNRVLIHLFK